MIIVLNNYAVGFITNDDISPWMTLNEEQRELLALFGKAFLSEIERGSPENATLFGKAFLACKCQLNNLERTASKQRRTTSSMGGDASMMTNLGSNSASFW